MTGTWVSQNKIKVMANPYNTIEFYETKKMKVLYVSIDPSLYQPLKTKGTPQSVNNLRTVNW